MSDCDLVPDETPWGHKDREGELFPGFTFVSTSRHGGLSLRSQEPDQTSVTQEDLQRGLQELLELKKKAASESQTA